MEVIDEQLGNLPRVVTSLSQDAQTTNSRLISKREAKIANHLQHWLSFIGKGKKLKALERGDCENYFYHSQKSTNFKIKKIAVQNEQSTFNACIFYFQKNSSTNHYSHQEKWLQTMLHELLSNLLLPKNRYLINKSANKRLKNAH